MQALFILIAIPVLVGMTSASYNVLMQASDDKDLDKVEVVDASTLRVTHKAPFADFLNVLAFGTYSIGSPTLSMLSITFLYNPAWLQILSSCNTG